MLGTQNLKYRTWIALQVLGPGLSTTTRAQPALDKPRGGRAEGWVVETFPFSSRIHLDTRHCQTHQSGFGTVLNMWVVAINFFHVGSWIYGSAQRGHVHDVLLFSVASAGTLRNGSNASWGFLTQSQMLL